jgi:endoglucanase
MSGEYETYVNARFSKMWEQIAIRFNGYGDKLIFEAANEMNEADDAGTGIEKRASRVNSLNQLFVQTIRATGGNNARRFLSIGSVSQVAGNLEYLEMPKDGRLIVQVHFYFNPPDFVLGWDERTNSVNHALDKATWKWSGADKNDKQPIDDAFDKIKVFTDKTGVPVILGKWRQTKLLKTIMDAV